MNNLLTYAIFVTLLFAALTGCGGDSPAPPDGPCGDVTRPAHLAAINVGNAGQLVVLSRPDLAPAAIAREVTVTVQAARRLETSSGVAKSGVAAYHFVRLSLDGVFWQNISAPDADDAVLPLPAGTCMGVLHLARSTVTVPAGSRLGAESVWAVVQPGTGEDLRAITDTFSLQLTH